MLNVQFISKIANKIVYKNFHCFFDFLVWFSGAASKDKKEKKKNKTKGRVINYSYQISIIFLI